MNCLNCGFDMGNNYEHCGASEDGVCPECAQAQDSIIVTKDNIHLYYEFMSDEDLLINERVTDSVFENRRSAIKTALNIKSFDLMKYENFEDGTRFVIKISFFGIKDTLKPIDEYIKEIKASKEYIAYAASR